MAAPTLRSAGVVGGYVASTKSFTIVAPALANGEKPLAKLVELVGPKAEATRVVVPSDLFTDKSRPPSERLWIAHNACHELTLLAAKHRLDEHTVRNLVLHFFEKIAPDRVCENVIQEQDLTPLLEYLASEVLADDVVLEYSDLFASMRQQEGQSLASYLENWMDVARSFVVAGVDPNGDRNQEMFLVQSALRRICASWKEKHASGHEILIKKFHARQGDNVPGGNNQVAARQAMTFQAVLNYIQNQANAHNFSGGRKIALPFATTMPLKPKTKDSANAKPNAKDGANGGSGSGHVSDSSKSRRRNRGKGGKGRSEGSPGKESKPAKFDGECFACGKSGHRVADCRNKGAVASYEAKRNDRGGGGGGVSSGGGEAQRGTKFVKTGAPKSNPDKLQKLYSKANVLLTTISELEAAQDKGKEEDNGHVDSRTALKATMAQFKSKALNSLLKVDVGQSLFISNDTIVDLEVVHPQSDRYNHDGKGLAVPEDCCLTGQCAVAAADVERPAPDGMSPAVKALVESANRTAKVSCLVNGKYMSVLLDTGATTGVCDCRCLLGSPTSGEGEQESGHCYC